MKSKVKVAVLDTGIDKKHDYLKDNIIGGISFDFNDNYIIASDNYNDENGHGTSCASIIKREFEDIEIFAVKVLNKYGKSNIQVLEEALKYILKTDIRLINLSLSVIESEMVEDLYRICNELIKNGKIIVSSLANGFEESYPAMFDNVIGVKGFILEDENSFWYNKDYNIQCVIDNNPYLSCDINNSYKLFGKCNSQASAKLTGKIANILSKKPYITFEVLQEELELFAKNNNWTNDDLLASKRYPNYKEKMYINDSDIFIGTVNAVKQVLGIDIYQNQLYKYSLFNSNVGLNYDNCFKLIKKIEEKFDIQFDYMNISRYDFVSIDTLIELVKKNIKTNI
ncbi:MAG: S8 family serine peptidase [Tepidibacter sp.]|uniref:S8 family serine peptidase n=1 Tax=Tepidibacter sp. TaxID=2529387 RepID=UPI0025E4D978|nr:S8 family serine peptidase [Tepidibacter sp.]MCT4507718.1 S8 family serine peptidase [Tepidibacter sp.]